MNSIPTSQLIPYQLARVIKCFATQYCMYVICITICKIYLPTVYGISRDYHINTLKRLYCQIKIVVKVEGLYSPSHLFVKWNITQIFCYSKCAILPQKMPSLSLPFSNHGRELAGVKKAFTIYIKLRLFMVFFLYIQKIPEEIEFQPCC